MELRYMGFEQRQNARAYWFEGLNKGEPSKHFIVTADLSLFHTHGVVLQEGPTLCASKLTADLERQFAGTHELTADDLVTYVTACSVRDAKRAEMRKTPRQRRSPTGEQSPWRIPR